MNRGGLAYADAGVDTERVGAALGALLSSVKQTNDLPRHGRPLLPLGRFANVLELRHGLGLAISTDGVGTKAVVAQMLDKYDTIGIDCVAMNVNDVLCVGAEPIAMTDYLAVETPNESVFRDLGIGLLEGARRARISIPGGEVAQIPDMIRGTDAGSGFDLVGTCVGLVNTADILVGQDIRPGDVVVGLSSSGIHSNGLSLARRALLEEARLDVSQSVAELGCTIGEELLRPTTIYVQFAVEALEKQLGTKAFVHITSDGFLNLNRVEAAVSFVLDNLPKPQPIFDLVRMAGDVTDEEMYRVFNMGIGFCAVVPPQQADSVCRLAESHGHRSQVIGYAVDDPTRTIRIPAKGLEGRGDHFYRV